MNKNILIGIVALGGLLLIGSLFFNNKEGGERGAEVTKNTETERVSLESLNLDIPIFPGSETVNINPKNPTAEDGVLSVTLSLKAEATITEVNEWYRGALSTNGWSIKSDRNIGGYQIIQGEVNDKYTSMQAANSEEEGFVKISQQVRVNTSTTE